MGRKAKLKIPPQDKRKKTTTPVDIKKILEDDPTIFAYDSIYDDIKRKKEEIVKDRKPRYITALMKAAELRKKEKQRRIEKKIYKGRKGNECEVIKDTEVF
ncbi:nuclear speckle splicing regulatory protein 1-like isoform X2 [Centruroides sculpturatus]|uniref:nuclear speckle splicing regulatory protein 1-like isoform X2 n=1 Tax=Centruroides sculpturatus TaxID=218467 RepID=UPI000C6CCB55|nr:nuclear speckle splicing regulatory protein 1-like isoform X2 [Centruroides sculpturatus]